jgi:hypothetical protein
VWYYQITGKQGHIFPHDENTIGVFTNRHSVRAKLMAILGACMHQNGYRECTVLVPLDRLDDAVEAIKARKRRKLSEEHRAKLVTAGAKTRF